MSAVVTIAMVVMVVVTGVVMARRGGGVRTGQYRECGERKRSGDLHDGLLMEGPPAVIALAARSRVIRS